MLFVRHVIQFNSAVPLAADQYQVLSNSMIFSQNSSVSGCFTPLDVRFHELATELKVPKCLTEVGIEHGDIDRLASEAMKQTRLLPNNPREVTLQDAVALYSAAM